jgi:hypothetical protein
MKQYGKIALGVAIGVVALARAYRRGKHQVFVAQG